MPVAHRRGPDERLITASLCALALVFSTLGSATAVTDGEPDGDGHPYVGIMVAQTADGTRLWRCSGTLISPALFLTAGACTEDPSGGRRTPTRTTTRTPSSSTTSAWKDFALKIRMVATPKLLQRVERADDLEWLYSEFGSHLP